jgi:hypothetical protein
MIRRAILTAATVAALLLGSTPASAACARTWTTRLPCASGDIASQWFGEDDLGRPATWLSGWIKPCGPAAARERFGFVYYVRDQDAPSPLGYVFHERLRRYSPGQTAFEGTVDPAVEELNGALIAICLAYGPRKLVDCVQPETPVEEGPPRPPLPTIQDLAGLPVVLADPFGPEPNCATCV